MLLTTCWSLNQIKRHAKDQFENAYFSSRPNWLSADIHRLCAPSLTVATPAI